MDGLRSCRQKKQRTILAEHGEIGMRFGAADYVHDVRLACDDLDRDDNDFVIGLIGKALFPLSALRAMREDPADLVLPSTASGPFSSAGPGR